VPTRLQIDGVRVERTSRYNTSTDVSLDWIAAARTISFVAVLRAMLPPGQEWNPLKLVRCKTQSDCEAIIVTPEQVFTILQQLPPLERVLTLLVAASKRFGFHNLRHGLSTYLVKAKADPKIVQTLMRHTDIGTTMNLYVQTMSEDRIEAQGLILEKLMQTPANGPVN